MKASVYSAFNIVHQSQVNVPDFGENFAGENIRSRRLIRRMIFFTSENSSLNVKFYIGSKW